MSEMVERVARAIATAQWGEENATDEAWRELPDIFEAARAAIAAMREPTGAMLQAAQNCPATREVDGAIVVASIHGASISKEFSGLNTPLQCWWRAMIDEARK